MRRTISSFNHHHICVFNFVISSLSWWFLNKHRLLGLFYVLFNTENFKPLMQWCICLVEILVTRPMYCSFHRVNNTEFTKDINCCGLSVCTTVHVKTGPVLCVCITVLIPDLVTVFSYMYTRHLDAMYGYTGTGTVFFMPL